MYTQSNQLLFSLPSILMFRRPQRFLLPIWKKEGTKTLNQDAIIRLQFMKVLFAELHLFMVEKNCFFFLFFLAIFAIFA